VVGRTVDVGLVGDVVVVRSVAAAVGGLEVVGIKVGSGTVGDAVTGSVIGSLAGKALGKGGVGSPVIWGKVVASTPATVITGSDGCTVGGAGAVASCTWSVGATVLLGEVAIPK